MGSLISDSFETITYINNVIYKCSNVRSDALVFVAKTRPHSILALYVLWEDVTP